MTFTDRVSKYPNRYKVTNQNGTVTYAYIERADEPTNAGTPLNAENLNTLLNVDMTSATPETVIPTLNADTLEGHRSSDFVTPAQMDNAINQRVVDIGASNMRTSTYDSNNDGIVNKADIAYKDENGRDIAGMMQRYVLCLTKSGETYSITDYVSGATLSFTDIYNKTRDTSLYVVCVYGASKLRPQYVNSTEMIFLGIDRATSSKVLRLHITPSTVAYRTYELAEASDVYTKSEIDTSLSGKANASDVMPKSGGYFTGNAFAYSTNRTGECLRNITVRDTAGTTDQSTNFIQFNRK